MNRRLGTTTRQVPAATDAEQAILGAALLSPSALEVLVNELEPDDFYIPLHQRVAEALRGLWDAGHLRVDAMLVAEELRAMHVDGFDPSVLVTLQNQCPSTGNADKYAGYVIDASVKRRLIGTSGEIAEMAYDEGTDARAAVEQANYLVGQVELPVRHAVPSPSAWDFVQIEHDADWLVQSLLERRDRLIVTGGEGKGKSTLLRQLAVTFAAGLHPFRFYPITPIKVLVVDGENSATQVTKALRPLMALPSNNPDWGNLRIEVRTEGLDLLSRHDQRWLLERVAANKPDLLITGPIYKLHAGDPNDEQSARTVARTFDQIRARYDCAIILETHSPHEGQAATRSLRPFGSSLWRRWPEFGYGLQPEKMSADDAEDGVPAMRFKPWRGPRDQRGWPRYLVPGGPGDWPWRDPDSMTGEPGF